MDLAGQARSTGCDRAHRTGDSRGVRYATGLRRSRRLGEIGAIRRMQERHGLRSGAGGGLQLVQSERLVDASQALAWRASELHKARIEHSYSIGPDLSERARRWRDAQRLKPRSSAVSGAPCAAYAAARDQPGGVRRRTTRRPTTCGPRPSSMSAMAYLGLPRYLATAALAAGVLAGAGRAEADSPWSAASSQLAHSGAPGPLSILGCGR
jgi:hypothetical protein